MCFSYEYHQEDYKEKEMNKAIFLDVKDDEIKLIGFELLNAGTEEYRQECWDELMHLMEIKIRGKIRKDMNMTLAHIKEHNIDPQ